MGRLIAIVGLALCALLLDAPTAECARCSKRACSSSLICGQGCSCLKPAGERRGSCVSFD